MKNKKKTLTKEPAKTETTTEQSVVSVNNYDAGADIMNGYNPSELVGKKGLKIYDEMRRDEQIKAAMGTKKHAILSSGWFITPGSEDEADKEISAFVEDNFDSYLAESFDNTLEELLTFLDYGYVVAEQNYFPEDGKLYLDTIKVRAPHDFEFHPDKFGNLGADGLRQWQGGQQKSMPLDKFIIYTYRKEFDNRYGRSDLEECYRPWFIKRELLKAEAIYLEKYGSAPMIVKVGMMKDEERTKLMNTLRKLRGTGVAILPKDVEADFANPAAGSAQTVFRKTIRDMDESISKAILLPNQLGYNSNETGSNAKAVTQFDVFLWIIGTIRKEIAEVIVNEQIVKRLVDINFGEQERYPQFGWRPFSEKKIEEIFELWLKAIDRGAVLPTEDDERYVRKQFNFPERTDETVLLPVKTPQPFGAPGDEEIEPEKKKGKQFARKFGMYKIEPSMQHADFVKIEMALNKYEDILYNDMENVIESMATEVVDRVENKKIIMERKFDEVDKFQLKNVGDLKLVFKKVFRQVFTDSTKLWKQEQQSQKKIFQEELLPEEYYGWLNSAAYMEAGKVADKYKTAVKQVMLQAINQGWSEAKSARVLHEVFARTKADNATVSPAYTEGQLKTIVRMNVSNSFNKARYLQGTELADKSDSDIYFQFSEILEGKTAESHPWSEFIHGKYVKAGTPLAEHLQYPMHFNDRGVVLTIDSAIDAIPPDKILYDMPDTGSYTGMTIG